MSTAQKQEAQGKPIVLPFGGDDYTIPTGEDWDIEVLEAAEAGQIVTATKTLLGPEQWAKFRAKHTKVGAIREFFEAAGEVIGGNS